jgi:hypothetical protein
MTETKRFIFSAISDKYERQNIKRPYSGEVDLFKVYDDELQAIWDAGAITSAEHKIYLLELLGGSCDVCGKKWVPFTYRHKLHGQEILSFTYYKPACNCYPHCKRCGRLLYVEVKDKKDTCMVCGNQRYCRNKVTAEAKDGTIYKRYCRTKMIPTLHGWKCPKCDVEKEKPVEKKEPVENYLPDKD